MHGDVPEACSKFAATLLKPIGRCKTSLRCIADWLFFSPIRVVLLFRSALIKGNVAAPCACAAYVRMKKNYLYMHVRGSCEQFEEHR